MLNLSRLQASTRAYVLVCQCKPDTQRADLLFLPPTFLCHPKHHMQIQRHVHLHKGLVIAYTIHGFQQ